MIVHLPEIYDTTENISDKGYVTRNFWSFYRCNQSIQPQRSILQQGIMADNLRRVEKLSSENYAVCKVQMKKLLVRKYFWDVKNRDEEED